jgi:hypothetical protein
MPNRRSEPAQNDLRSKVEIAPEPPRDQSETPGLASRPALAAGGSSRWTPRITLDALPVSPADRDSNELEALLHRMIAGRGKERATRGGDAALTRSDRTALQRVEMALRPIANLASVLTLSPPWKTMTSE